LLYLIKKEVASKEGKVEDRGQEFLCIQFVTKGSARGPWPGMSDY